MKFGLFHNNANGQLAYKICSLCINKSSCDCKFKGYMFETKIFRFPWKPGVENVTYSILKFERAQRI